MTEAPSRQAESKQLSANLKISEFACKDGSEKVYHFTGDFSLFIPVLKNIIQISGAEVLYYHFSIYIKNVQAPNRLQSTVYLCPLFHITYEVHSVGIPPTGSPDSAPHMLLRLLSVPHRFGIPPQRRKGRNPTHHPTTGVSGK